MTLIAQHFRDISDQSLRRTIMSCVWLIAIARSASGCSDLAAWMENLAGHCLDERKRRQRARRYQACQVRSGALGMAISPAYASVWKREAKAPVRDPLTAAFFGSLPVQSASPPDYPDASITHTGGQP